MNRKDEPRTYLADDVRRYYDDNTARFEQRGQGGASIHRAVWGPGVTTREAAFRYVDDLILAELGAFEDIPTVLDLGCGLGATLMYLASRRELAGEGVTISSVQATRATELVQAAGLAGRVRCREANFLALPPDLRDVHLAFSIEAFVHSPDSGGYFAEAARVLRRGGKLIICDDFLTSRAGGERAGGERAGGGKAARERRWIEEFRRGWHVGSLIAVEDARQLGDSVGLTLVRDVDLTPHLELRRLRDRVIGLLVGVGRHWPIQSKYWHALLGGEALQHALRAHVLAYRFLVFERR